MHPAAQRSFDEAMSLQRSGRLAEAEAGYRSALAIDPNHADAMHYLGIVLHQLQRTAEGIKAIERATHLLPENAGYFCNLGVILAGAGELPQAIVALERATILRPDFPEAFSNLGSALKRSGHVDRASDAYRHAIALRPGYVEAHFNLALLLHEQGDLTAAISEYHRAITLKPDYLDALSNLGTALQAAGQYESAAQTYRRAIQLAPNNAQAHGNLGSTLGLVGKLTEARAELTQAIQLRPEVPEFHANLASILRDEDRLDEAMAEVNAALSINPGMPHALGTRAGILKDRGQLDEAIAAYRKAVEVSGDSKIADSLLLTLHYHPDYDAARLFPEHAQWERQFASRYYATWPTHANDRNSERPVRIGYVGDLSNSPIGRFLLPLLKHHDRASYQAYCYADVQRPDPMTEKLRSQAFQWRNVTGLDDGQLASQIMEDQIDILVDLSMHGGRNRLLTFARKPAPVQVTYLAYVSTTGLRAIDYRLTDPQLDPTGDDQPYYSERSVRLPRTYWCYQPPDNAPPVASLPALTSGTVTFGSMNRSAKITPQAFAAWCQVLKATAHSRLILHWGEGSHRDEARRKLSQYGIDPSRLEFVAALPFNEYLQQYNRFDIALDPFPYPGGTTTCDALWMGVPVVTLAGRTASSRGGLSIMTNLALPELVARNVDQYIEIATALATDFQRLELLRSTLRPRMLASPLMDAPQFAKDVETAFRQMWRTRCESGHQ
jgi:predicted O-linked N-acetylglucosamine transferase (SPINDLY family)